MARGRPDPSLPGPAQPGPALSPSQRAQGGMLTPGVGGATPFAAHQVDLGSNVAPSSANSMRVVTIVFGLAFVLGAALVGAALVLVVSLITMGGGNLGGTNQQAAGKTHVRDTGLVEEVDLREVTARKVKAAQQAEEANRDPMAEMFGGLGAAPVTVYVEGKGKDMYRQIEILCDQVGFRGRANLVNDKAHIAIVPAARCRLVFQGNVPMRGWVTGGDTVRCSFQPFKCVRIN